MTTFVLIHGAFHGGWCWDRVAPLMEAKGHTVFAPDMPSHGDDPMDAADVTLDDYMTRVGVVLTQAPEPVILVGHSLGGITITQAGENYAGLISKLVYLTAFIPDNNESRFDLDGGGAEGSLSGQYRQFSGDNKTMTIQDEGVKPTFYADCDDETVDWVKERLCPQATLIAQTKVQTSDAGWGSIPRAYIECTEDRAIPIAQQRACWEAHPCDTVITMETSHSPFMSAPEALADHLHSLA